MKKSSWTRLLQVHEKVFMDKTSTSYLVNTGMATGTERYLIHRVNRWAQAIPGNLYVKSAVIHFIYINTMRSMK